MANEKNYHGFWYRISYECKVKDSEGRVIMNFSRQAAPCFGNIFDGLWHYKGQFLEGVYTIHCEKQFKNGSGNFCALTKSEVEKVLRYMRKALDIQIHCEDTPDQYNFTFKIAGYPVKHKYVLTFSRVFYEFPFNELARDVFRLRETGTHNGVNYSHKSFLELYNLVSASYGSYPYNGHGLFNAVSIDTHINTLKASFDDSKIFRVNDVLPGKWNLNRGMTSVANDPRKVDWDNNFDTRIVKYSENFKILKTLKQNEKGIRRRARKAV